MRFLCVNFNWFVWKISHVVLTASSAPRPLAVAGPLYHRRAAKNWTRQELCYCRCAVPFQARLSAEPDRRCCSRVASWQSGDLDSTTTPENSYLLELLFVGWPDSQFLLASSRAPAGCTRDAGSNTCRPTFGLVRPPIWVPSFPCYAAADADCARGGGLAARRRLCAAPARVYQLTGRRFQSATVPLFVRGRPQKVAAR